MGRWRRLLRSLCRILALLAIILGAAGLAYSLWSPGFQVRDGRHDLGTNGIWIQHGWLADDRWFGKQSPEVFRSPERIGELARRLRDHGIRFIYPHLCPCKRDGTIAASDPAQVERLLDGLADFQVLPWIGGVFGGNCLLNSEGWLEGFSTSAVRLLQEHPRLAGIHVNIEPLPSGDADFLRLLARLRGTLPKGKILSIAAYPPPTRWQPVREVHWDADYFQEVARHSDQVVVMMYDTGIRFTKLYQSLLAAWTREVLEWAPGAQVLLGLPAYEDAGVRYHDPAVENLMNALQGAHSGLAGLPRLPSNYAGIAIYSEWEMDNYEWTLLEREFNRTSKNR